MNYLRFPDPPPGWKRRTYIGFGAIVLASIDIATAFVLDPLWAAVPLAIIYLACLIVLARQVL